MVTTQPKPSISSSYTTIITAVADGPTSFSDPFHPGCKRVITKQEGGKVKIEGSDNVDGSAPWTLFATEDKNGMLAKCYCF